MTLYAAPVRVHPRIFLIDAVWRDLCKDGDQPPPHLGGEAAMAAGYLPITTNLFDSLSDALAYLFGEVLVVVTQKHDLPLDPSGMS